MPVNKKSKRSKFRVSKLIIGVVVLVVLVLVVLELTNTTHFFHKASDVIPSTSPTITSSSGTKSANGSSTATSNTSTNTTNTTTNTTTSTNPKTGSPTASTAPLLAPFGTFVSDHHPNLSGSPAPSAEQSVCNTTPSATCYISFTNNGVTKSLATQTADNNGSTYWSWDVNKNGLSAGDWTVTAYATLNGVTSSTKDPQTLDVSP